LGFDISDKLVNENFFQEPFFFFLLFSVCVMGIRSSRRRRQSALRGKRQAIGFGENEKRFEGSAMAKKESKEE